ncbi:hypothetical protein A2774_01990 [Candidatus Roizmanbacteria bacterium RIFCSPHIGHO2_01_FULL_39_12c]|uniref:HTH merR-type domain-containing protein n=1 Tax=Candidatus Roizmanbacteria bacterium RIFCSPHIGHO2_01_FULL_39_12c TaxID=1802031 RepID=A0A1F7GFM6_9BACT|nr:MAG: hypothetical protein A2774_01990 [Candidatus Roizmanbacteria bacterium RIFCSPHIGHO2_01_FULL_39_12c]OGK47218.1 MAG: hypothetical protein A2963_04090 [Candidatus Roizmanbacteria bacterium RIFCSPLOWO2_01_FULL_40_13]
MILVASNLIGEFLKDRKENKLNELLNDPKYTVSDTSLSYRQTNSLDEDNLLASKRKNKSSWRKFSYKELVYFEIIIELKKFGIKQEQLKTLWEMFFKEPSENKKEIVLTSKLDGEMALYCIWGGIEMTLVFYSNGRIVISDPLNLIRLSQEEPQIRIPINAIVNKLHPQIGLEVIPLHFSLQNVLFDKCSITSTKEKELLEIIRNKDYSVVKIKKKNGEAAIVYAEKNKNIAEITPNTLLKLLETKDFMDMSIVRRDGKIMNYKIEETIKL